MSRPPSNARQIPLHPVIAMQVPDNMTEAQRSAAFSLSAWLSHRGKIHVDVDNTTDFEAIAAMMRHAVSPEKGITLWGRDVNDRSGDLQPGRYVFLNNVYGNQSYFILYMEKKV